MLKEYREAGNAELAVLRESDASYYLREERMGWILGPYERHAPACFVDGVPESFEKDLFPGELDRLLPHVEAAMNRVPSFENAGIKDIVNGPIAYTPDGNPMVGPAFGLENFWLSEGHSFGITAAGGAGWQLAEWIVDGEPTVDMIGVDPAALRRGLEEFREDQERRGLRARLHQPLSDGRAPASAGPPRPRPATSGWTGPAPSGARASAGSGRTGSRRSASNGRTITPTAAPTGSPMSATRSAPCANGSA